MGYTGPAEEIRIVGTLDSEESKVGTFGNQQEVLTFVDVTQTYDDDSTRELETRTIYIGSKGEAGRVFANSVRKELKMPEKVDGHKTDVTGPLLGRCCILDVARKVIEIEGEPKTMVLYTFKGFKGEEKSAATDADVLEYLNGKTPAEAIAGRSKFSGTPYAALLASKTKTLEGFNTVTLVDGHYIA